MVFETEEMRRRNHCERTAFRTDNVFTVLREVATLNLVVIEEHLNPYLNKLYIYCVYPYFGKFIGSKQPSLT